MSQHPAIYAKNEAEVRYGAVVVAAISNSGVRVTTQSRTRNERPIVHGLPSPRPCGRSNEMLMPTRRRRRGQHDGRPRDRPRGQHGGHRRGRPRDLQSQR